MNIVVVKIIHPSHVNISAMLKIALNGVFESVMQSSLVQIRMGLSVSGQIKMMASGFNLLSTVKFHRRNFTFVPMIQQLLIGLIFSGALFYVGRLIYRNFQAKSGCATGCGKCGAVDFSKIEEQLKSKNL